MSRKNIIDRVLNRPSESRGSQPSGLLPVLFVEAKRIKMFLVGSIEVSQTSNQHTATAVSHRPIKTFFRRAEIHGASGRRPLPRKHAARAFTPLQGASRFCKPRISVRHGDFVQIKSDPFAEKTVSNLHFMYRFARETCYTISMAE